MADLWKIAEADPELSVLDVQQEEGGSTVLFVGDAASGKSSLIQSFLKPNSSKDPKPTFALEYSFARRKNAPSSSSSASSSSSSSSSSQVAHLWELGGDIYEPKLLDVPLSIKSIQFSSIIIVCDLSKPKNVFASLKRWVSQARDIVQRRLAALSEAGGEAAEAVARLKDRASAPYGSTHADIARVRPCEVPLCIVGNKYDSFKALSLADRRALVQVLRFVAHYHGATLLLTSAFEREAFRSLLNAACFGLPTKAALDVALDKPAIVTAGKDDFTSILLGVAPGASTASDEAGKSKFAYSESDVGAFLSAHGVARDCWAKFSDVLAQCFGAPDPDPVPAGSAADEAKDEGGSAEADAFPEAEVDEMRAQRDEALLRYKAEAERRQALNSSVRAGPGPGPAGGGGDAEAQEAERGGESKRGDERRRRK